VLCIENWEFLLLDGVEGILLPGKHHNAKKRRYRLRHWVNIEIIVESPRVDQVLKVLLRSLRKYGAAVAIPREAIHSVLLLANLVSGFVTPNSI
jgi:hypothetical protein